MLVGIFQLIYSKVAQRAVIIGQPEISVVAVVSSPAVLTQPCAIALWLLFKMRSRIAVVPADYGNGMIGKSWLALAVGAVVLT